MTALHAARGSARLIAVTLLAASWLVLPDLAVAAVATQVAAGYRHTCVIDAAGGLSCWGRNVEGQLGDGTNDDSATPVGVVGLASGVASVAGGAGFTCAVTTGGGAKCWGDGSNGKLGAGFGPDSSTPLDVTGLGSGVAAVTAGSQHACALTTTGGVKCWGWNAYGQLGHGSSDLASGTPVDVVGLASGVLAVTAGAVHTCALTDAGTVKCWGYNASGQLGDGTTSHSNVPVDVVGLAGVTAIDAGSQNNAIVSTYRTGTCALTVGGGLKCWGAGFGTTATDLPGLTSDVAAFSLGSPSTGVALTTAGTVERFTQSVAMPNVARVSGLDGGIVEVAQGVTHQCARTDLGEVKCWGGSNTQGELGEGTTGPTTINAQFPGCVFGFGDGDLDRICDSADPCTGGTTFVAARRPKLMLARVAADPTPGDDKVNLRARVALPAGVAFADLDPMAEGARVTLVDPGGVVIDRVIPAGAYGGPGTAGWFTNGPGTTWRFLDATTRPVATRIVLADRSKGASGGEVDVTVARIEETVPLATSDVPLQAIVVLGDAAAGSAGRCGQSDFRIRVDLAPECTFNGKETTLTCRVRKR